MKTVFILILLIGTIQAGLKKIFCQDDTLCHDKVSPFYFCKVEENESDEDYGKKHCQHKKFWPLQPMEWVGTFIFASFMLLANVGGIGGGGVAIPLIQLFFGWGLKNAIAISSFSILICTIARWIFNFKEAHPEKKMVSIDYGMTNVMMPLTLIGAQIGAILFIVTPDLIIAIVLTLLLLVLAIESIRKAFEVKRLEDEKLAKLKEDTNLVKVQDEPAAGGESKEAKITTIKAESSRELRGLVRSVTMENVTDHEGGEVEMITKEETKADAAGVEFTEQNAKKEDKAGAMEFEEEQAVKKEDTPIEAKKAEIMPEKKDENCDEWGLPLVPSGDQTQAEINSLRGLIKQERSHFIWKKQLINFVSLIGLCCLNIFAGGKLESVSFKKCSAGYWICLVAFIVIMLLVVILSAKLVASEQAKKIKYNNVNLVPSDLVFRGKVLATVLFLGFFGGWVAGALGLGGGVIFNPLLLKLGVPPKVSSATGMYLIMFSKVAACLVYILAGYLDITYGAWIAGWSAIFACVGLAGANWFMSKFKRQSIIVFCLALVMWLSVVGVPVFSAIDLQKAVDRDEDISSFKSLCD